MSEENNIYQCQTSNCGYIYDEQRGDRRKKIKPGTKFDALSETWKCPICGASKKRIKPVL